MEGGLCDFVWSSQCKLYIEHFRTWVNTESEKRTWSIELAAVSLICLLNGLIHGEFGKDLQLLKQCCEKNIWLVTNIFNNTCICLDRTITFFFFSKWSISISYLAINLSTFLCSFFPPFFGFIFPLFFPSSKTHMLAHTHTDRGISNFMLIIHQFR